LEICQCAMVGTRYEVSLWVLRGMGPITLAASLAGNGDLSMTVMVVFSKRGLLQREYAVVRPKTPAPTMRMEEGMWFLSIRLLVSAAVGDIMHAMAAVAMAMTAMNETSWYCWATHQNK
jgi:hypothetical protein